MSTHLSELPGQEIGWCKLGTFSNGFRSQNIYFSLDISNDSDIECSQSVCSDTHSDNTSASGLTDKSTVSDSTIHGPSGTSETDKGNQGSVTPGELTQ